MVLIANMVTSGTSSFKASAKHHHESYFKSNLGLPNGIFCCKCTDLSKQENKALSPLFFLEQNWRQDQLSKKLLTARLDVTSAEI